LKQGKNSQLAGSGLALGSRASALGNINNAPRTPLLLACFAVFVAALSLTPRHERSFLAVFIVWLVLVLKSAGRQIDLLQDGRIRG
jgi:hypothetical protein